jgi:ribonuclease R
VHRIVRRLARAEPIPLRGLSERLQAQALQSSQRERRAMGIEREVVDLYGAFLMRNQVGQVFDGVISGVTEHGFYASIDSPFVDVLCRVATLPPDHYQLDAFGVRLWGLRSGRSFALGDRLRLRIEDVSIAQRKVSAVPADLARDSEQRGEDQPPARMRRRRRQQELESHKERVETRRSRKQERRERVKHGKRGKGRSQPGRRAGQRNATPRMAAAGAVYACRGTERLRLARGKR